MIRLVLGLAMLASGVSAQEVCRDDTVQLRGDWGSARFRVELADDPDERAQGLMNRATMPMGAGMLFVFDATRPVSFWMKNTLIPLDMIFIDEQGVVVNVHPEAVPHDPTSIPSKGAVRYVLEINGGLSAAMGIGPGTELRHPSVLQDHAIWPC